MAPEEGRPPVPLGQNSTVAQILELPEARVGKPEVVAAGDLLDRCVRWVHASDSPELATQLEGGELIVTTGAAIGDSAADQHNYARSLAAAGAVGILLELGNKFDSPPEGLSTACAREQLPLIVFRRPASFVKFVEAAQSNLMTQQLSDLRFAEFVHHTFMHLSLEEATMYKIVKTVSGLAGCPAVLENLMHRVLAYEPTADVSTEVLLSGWEARSRAAPMSQTTEVVGREAWLTTPVVVRTAPVGRLVLLTKNAPTPTQIRVLERGASALMIRLSYQRTPDQSEGDADKAAIYDLIHRRHCGERQMSTRLGALGLPVRHRSLAGVIIEIRSGGENLSWKGLEENALSIVRTCSSVHDAKIVAATLPDSRLNIVASVPPKSTPDKFLDAVYHKLGELLPQARVIISLGAPAEDITGICRSLEEAAQVAKSITDHTVERIYYSTNDIQLRGLFALLRDDPEVHTFIERTIGALLDYDIRNGSDHLAILHLYLNNGRNKVLAAQAAGISRRTVYERLSVVSRILRADLSDDETCTSIHAAIIARESVMANHHGPTRVPEALRVTHPTRFTTFAPPQAI